MNAADDKLRASGSRKTRHRIGALVSPMPPDTIRLGRRRAIRHRRFHGRRR
jgi:hypothetical protein